MGPTWPDQRAALRLPDRRARAAPQLARRSAPVLLSASILVCCIHANVLPTTPACLVEVLQNLKGLLAYVGARRALHSFKVAACSSCRMTVSSSKVYLGEHELRERVTESVGSSQPVALLTSVTSIAIQDCQIERSCVVSRSRAEAVAPLRGDQISSCTDTVSVAIAEREQRGRFSHLRRATEVPNACLRSPGQYDTGAIAAAVKQPLSHVRECQGIPAGDSRPEQPKVPSAGPVLAHLKQSRSHEPLGCGRAARATRYGHETSSAVTGSAPSRASHHQRLYVFDKEWPDSHGPFFMCQHKRPGPG